MELRQVRRPDDGLTTAKIHKQRPGWRLFRDGCPEGESVEEIGNRADRVIDRLRALDGDVLLFSSGHFMRVFAARWLGLDASWPLVPSPHHHAEHSGLRPRQE